MRSLFTYFSLGILTLGLTSCALKTTPVTNPETETPPVITFVDAPPDTPTPIVEPSNRTAEPAKQPTKTDVTKQPGKEVPTEDLTKELDGFVDAIMKDL